MIKANGSVDEKATLALRAKMAKKRGKTKLFDFGGTIPELKKACKRETGLEPPKPPVFQTWAKPAQPKEGNGKKGTRKAA